MLFRTVKSSKPYTACKWLFAKADFRRTENVRLYHRVGEYPVDSTQCGAFEDGHLLPRFKVKYGKIVQFGKFYLNDR